MILCDCRRDNIFWSFNTLPLCIACNNIVARTARCSRGIGKHYKQNLIYTIHIAEEASFTMWICLCALRFTYDLFQTHNVDKRCIFTYSTVQRKLIRTVSSLTFVLVLLWHTISRSFSTNCYGLQRLTLIFLNCRQWKKPWFTRLFWGHSTKM